MDVHLGSADRIGMKRKRHMKHLHPLAPRERTPDEGLAELIALAPDDGRRQSALNTGLEQTPRTVSRGSPIASARLAVHGHAEVLVGQSQVVLFVDPAPGSPLGVLETLRGLCLA